MGFIFLIYFVLGLPLPLKSQPSSLLDKKENNKDHSE